MTELFATRMKHVDDSFIREILKVTDRPEVISFAGGLPNPKLFPVTALAEAAGKVIKDYGKQALQYSITEGYLPLREFIADRYFQKEGLRIDPDEILIVNGSQQAIDLVSKVFLNKGDHVIIEKPGYVGAIQSISLYEPVFHSVALTEEGADCKELEAVLGDNPIRMMYAIPNFQNPSGITYSRATRSTMANLLRKHSVFLLEDNPYGDLRFMGIHNRPIKSELGDLSILMGSFSKITVPGIRLGWVCAEKKVMQKLKIVKQAADLHSNYLAQRILYEYLKENSLDDHIATINRAYKSQRDCMVSELENRLPADVTYTRPEGGMFLWVTLPAGKSSIRLFELAIKKNVAFVPGQAFHLNGEGDNSFRLNFSNSDTDQITEGIGRLAAVIETNFY
jgi:2-aminoadipate transaminase